MLLLGLGCLFKLLLGLFCNLLSFSLLLSKTFSSLSSTLLGLLCLKLCFFLLSLLLGLCFLLGTLLSLNLCLGIRLLLCLSSFLSCFLLLLSAHLLLLSTSLGLFRFTVPLGFHEDCPKASAHLLGVQVLAVGILISLHGMISDCSGKCCAALLVPTFQNLLRAHIAHVFLCNVTVTTAALNYCGDNCRARLGKARLSLLSCSCSTFCKCGSLLPPLLLNVHKGLCHSIRSHAITVNSAEKCSI